MNLVHTKDITDKQEIIVKTISEFNINGWVNEYFESHTFFGERRTFWKLKIDTDNFKISCSGQNKFPDNWEKFSIQMRKLGIPIH